MNRNENDALRNALREIRLCAEMAKAEHRTGAWRDALVRIIEFARVGLKNLPSEKENEP